MTKSHVLAVTIAASCLILGFAASHWAAAEDNVEKAPTRLAVVWTSGDADVAHRMLFMYVNASQRASWFDENLVIVWGPSSRLLAGDKDLQAKVKSMQKAGVRFQACIACSESYGVTQDLRDLGIEVKAMGKPLTDLLQDDRWDVMTF